MTKDVHCPVCDEPWDRYGVTHGDMTPDEAAAFYQGEGCPACRFGTKQHRRNTNPRPGILAQRLQEARRKESEAQGFSSAVLPDENAEPR